MPKVRIVTDSACDLTDAEVAEHDIAIVPLSIRFGARELTDRVELDTAEFYRLLASSTELPQTAAPAPGAFAETFRRLHDEGADQVVCINLSSKLSATMQAAQSGASLVADRIPVEVVDSRSITAGLGTIVLHAARAARDGADATDIVRLVEDLRDRQCVLGTLDTLEYLKRGGRIGGAAALVGSMLSIKPLLDLSTGEVREAGKTRTRKKAFAWLRDRVVDHGPVENLRVMHSQAADIDEFLSLLADAVDVDQVQVGPIGAVIGSHGGPGVVGVAFHRTP